MGLFEKLGKKVLEFYLLCKFCTEITCFCVLFSCYRDGADDMDEEKSDGHPSPRH